MLRCGSPGGHRVIERGTKGSRQGWQAGPIGLVSAGLVIEC